MASLLRRPRTYLLLVGAVIIVVAVSVRLTGGTFLASSSEPAGDTAPTTTTPQGLQLPAAPTSPAVPSQEQDDPAAGDAEEARADTAEADDDVDGDGDGAAGGDPGEAAPADGDPADAGTAEPPEATEPPVGTVLFSDDFNQLDTGWWLVADHASDVNQELQYYSPANVAVAGGALRLSAEARETGERQYASGMVTTAGRFSFTYGTVEWRARPAKGQGLWQALWLHGADCAPTFQSGSQLCPSWPAPGSEEIDVFEYRGGLPQQIHMAFHHNTEPGRTAGMDCQFDGPDYSADWHTFAIEWTPEQLVWKVDGVERCRAASNVPSTPMYLVMNFAVGGFWAGEPNANTVFPQSFQIDWVRVTRQ